MEDELKCVCCLDFYVQPVLLPCFHAMCLNCALHQQQPLDCNAHSSGSSTTTTTASVAFLQQQQQHPINGESLLIQQQQQQNDCSSVSDQMSDQLSTLSETDSGVSLSINSSSTSCSRQSSNCNSSSSSSNATATAYYSLCCPSLSCRKMVYFDENGAHNLPRYKAMETIVDKFIINFNSSNSSSSSSSVQQQQQQCCQLCPPPLAQQQQQSQLQRGGGGGDQSSPAAASVYCQQCQVFYCDRCRESCHPMRGPLAKHNLLPASQMIVSTANSSISSNVTQKMSQQQQQERCPQHADQLQTYFCNTCKVAACHFCLLHGDASGGGSGRRQHDNHDVQLLTVICKQQKSELTQSLQQLSEKAKRASEAIQRLKSSSEHVQESCIQVESAIRTRCAQLIEALERRQETLIEFARRERDVHLRRLRDEVSTCTAHLQSTTALVQFCIEALKEADSSQAAFLQIASMLDKRVSNLDSTWRRQEIEQLASRRLEIGGASSSFPISNLQLTLDDSGLRRSIDQLTFLEMKPPGAPQFVADECSAENNSVTVSWRLPLHPVAATSFVDGFILEMDDGCGGGGSTAGRFREVYCGKENVCTVDGLHFNSLYSARVKAFNSSGHGPYSQPLSLHTAQVAWFTFDTTVTVADDDDAATGSSSVASETRLSPDALTATTDSYEPRVILGSVGFSRGVHYWEFSVDRYDNGTADPAFGIARRNVARDAMLGKDDLGWSMYIDSQRSWLLHANVHSKRTEGGIQVGSTVGVLLDLDRRQLSFYVNDECRQGSAATSMMLLDDSTSASGGGGVFYPAVSLNRNVQVTLHSALDPPCDAPESASSSSASSASGIHRHSRRSDSGEESDEYYINHHHQQQQQQQDVDRATSNSLSCAFTAASLDEYIPINNTNSTRTKN